MLTVSHWCLSENGTGGGRTRGLSCEWEGAPGALLRAVGENTSPTFKRHKRCMLSEKSNCEAL